MEYILLILEYISVSQQYVLTKYYASCSTGPSDQLPYHDEAWITNEYPANESLVHFLHSQGGSFLEEIQSVPF